MSYRFRRRDLLFALATAACLTTTAVVDGPHATGYANQVVAATPRPEAKKKRIVVIGSHPEDPEFACGGLIARLAKAGHEVIVASATSFRGDRKIGNEPEAVVRRRDSTAACEILGATSYFFEFDHSKLVADDAALEIVVAWFQQTKPDIVLSHWPLDTQSNRHVTGSLVWQAYLREKKWSLYFFEGLTDYQTIAFTPEYYYDVTDVQDLKKEACYRLSSHKPEQIWVDQEDVNRRRGLECGVRYAEALVLAEPGQAVLPLPSLKKKKTGRE